MIAPTYNMTTRVTLALACLAMTAFAGKRQPADIAARLNALTGDSTPSVVSTRRRLVQAAWGKKHKTPTAPYTSDKWGIYSKYGEQTELLKQMSNNRLKPDLRKAQYYAERNEIPPGVPSKTIHGNDHPCVRERYIVRNSKNEVVYLVKTVGKTGNAGFFDGNPEGDKREAHNENTLGEFRRWDEQKRRDIWYTVYWRCQKPDHDECSHETHKEEIEKQTPTPSPDMEVPEWEKHHKYLPGRDKYVAPEDGNHENAYHFQDHEKLTVTSKPWTEEGLFADDFTDDTDDDHAYMLDRRRLPNHTRAMTADDSDTV